MDLKTGMGPLAVCSASLLLAPAAAAQVAATPPAQVPTAAVDQGPPTDEQGSGFGDVVVTARRRAENAQDVPVTVVALGSEQLEVRGVRTEGDLQIAFPGLVIRSANNGNQLNYVIRGESVDAYSGSPPGVQPYVNEVPFAVGSATNFFDLENVQVVKGPQGTLFGRNSTGGAVLFQTQRPTNGFEGYGLVQYGNFDRLVTEGAINLPIVSDKVLLRLAGTFTSGGAFVRNLYDNKLLGDRQERSIRGSLLLEPVAGLTNTTMLQLNRSTGTNAPNVPYYAIPCGQPDGFNSCIYSPSTPAFGQLLAGNGLPGYPNGYVYPGGFESLPAFLRAQGPYVVDQNAPFDFRSTSHLLVNKTELELGGNLTLKNIFGYSYAKNQLNYDTDYSPYPIIGQNSPETLASGGPIDRETQRTRTFSDELQLQGSAFDGRLTFLLGGFYIDSREDYLSPLVLSGIIPPNDFLQPISVAYNARTGNTSKAIFGQATYKLGSRTNFTAGGRYTWEEITMRQLGRSIFGVGQPQRVTQNNPSWTFTIDHHLTDEIMVYATNRGSWRRGGFNPFNPPTPTPQTAATGTGGNYFLPEKVVDVELGVKVDARLGTVPVRFNLAGYRSWVDDIQKTAYVVIAGTASSATINVPKSRISGIEADLSFRPAQWLSAGGSITYTDAQFTDNEALLFGLPVAYGPFGDVPEVSATVFADASLPLGGERGSLNYHVDMYAQSAFYFSNLGGTIQPGTRLPGYALLNMRLDWADMFGSKVKASVFVKNLTDKEYFIGGSAGAQNFSVESATWGQPRTYGVSLRVAF